MKRTRDGYARCQVTKQLLATIARLEEELREANARAARLADVIASEPALRNTDMIVGAALSGGDPMALAKRLAGAK